MPHPFTPQVGDIFRKGGQEMRVMQVLRDGVSLLKAGDPAPVYFEETLFYTMSANSFAQGAVLIRDGVQIQPPPGLSGSHNAHARLSPSDSKRWMNCTLSIAYEEANAHRVPEDTSSDYSREGTEAHDWATKLLLKQIGEDEIPDTFRAPVVAYAEKCMSCVPDAVLTHLDACIEEAELGLDPPDKAYFVEEQVPLFYQPDQNGTADFLALEADRGTVTRLFGYDYKHGEGVLVQSQDNSQIAIYVLSAVHKLSNAYRFTNDTVIEMGVVQPRHREAATQTPWTMKFGDLKVAIAEEIEAKAEIAREAADAVRAAVGSSGRDVSCAEVAAAAPMAVFAPSEGDGGACRWCACKAFCEARFAENTAGLEGPSMDAAAMLESMPTLDKSESKLPVEQKLGIVSEALGMQGVMLTDEYLVRAFAKAKAITAWLGDVEEYLEARLLAGEEIEGLKLVDGREGNRAWASEEAAETFLRGQGLKQDERFDYKLKSPAKIEALLKDKLKNTRTKNRFEELITRSSAKKKVAIDADTRQAVSPMIAAMPTADDFEV